VREKLSAIDWLYHWVPFVETPSEKYPSGEVLGWLHRIPADATPKPRADRPTSIINFFIIFLPI
jgi:hypothetical protein